jgi:hypothetical protein
LIHGFLELHSHRLQGAQAPQRARAGLAATPFAAKSANNVLLHRSKPHNYSTTLEASPVGASISFTDR